MKPTQDLRVEGYIPLMVPEMLRQELPVSAVAYDTVSTGRQDIQNILTRTDNRLLVVVGPCSIHDEAAALEYARRLGALKKKVAPTMVLVMRTYFEKPRTTVGWKGFINDPGLDDSCDIMTGLRKARKLLLQIAEIGVPVGVEFLETITPQYISGLISWGAIGARTTESQTHRQMVSGLSMPVGFKNGTDGNLSTAINGVLAARAPQSFLGIDQQGRTSIVKTRGNPHCHIVLRGGRRPNYDTVSVEETRAQLVARNVPEIIMVDCSHANSRKKFEAQATVWKNVVEQRLGGNEALVGLMLESNLHPGNQKFNGAIDALQYGVSITDACISWETTEALLLWAHERLGGAL